jgi:RimJ/RimL family protein N-acetyltransferase
MSKANPAIRGEKVWLRAMEREDLDAYLRAMNDAELGVIAGSQYPKSKLATERWYEKLMTERHGTDGYYLAICTLADDRLIGFAWLWRLDLVHGSAEFSIVLADEECLNQGYGTDTTCVIQDFGFGELRLERIHLTTSAENRRAVHCYEKAGFVVEGTLRHYRRMHGKMIDGLLMSVLREEWEARQAAEAA